MFASLRTLTLTLAPLALALFSLGAPAPQYGSQCNGGPVQCCNATYTEDSYEGKLVLASFGIDARTVPQGMIAAACGGGDVNVGAGSTWCVTVTLCSKKEDADSMSLFCSQNAPVCCEDNYFGTSSYKR